jgi:KaiC/GvpD/RAD55 family RecA-like ATPase
MSRDPGPGYGFADGVPVDPVDPGSTVLVAGPALSRTEDLAVSMVADGTGSDEGALFVSTNTTSETLLRTCGRANPSFDPSRAGVVDCTGQDPGRSRLEAQVKLVSTQSDLTGIGMKFSALYESLYANAASGRVRTGLMSLSSLSMYVDLRDLYRFAHTLSSRIKSAGGLGVFTIDPTTHDTKTVNTLAQVAEGRIDVRESDEAAGELRVRGLPGRSGGWRPFSLP